jgi:hypothetical protein
MATKTNKDILAFCQNELQRSKNWRNHKGGYGYDDEWKRFVDLYNGRHYDSRSGTDQLIVNVIFSTINTMAPAVAINQPRFVVNARQPESAPQAVVTEEVLNYLWRSNDYQRDFRLAVLDFLICGHGWLKVGWAETKEPVVKEADEAQPNNQVMAASEGGDQGIDDKVDTEGNSETNLDLPAGTSEPYVERCSLFDMYVDPDARHPKELRWIAQRTWRATADVVVDSRYSATARKRVSGSHYSMWDNNNGDARAGASDNNYTSEKPDAGAMSYCEIIEFYDLRRNTVGTFAVSADGDDSPAASSDSGWLIKPAKIPYATGHPFVMLRNYEVPDHFYPIGDVKQIESLQLELNETRTQMLNYRKKFRRAWTYKKDAFDRDGIRALQSDEDNVMVPVQGGEDPAGAIVSVPAAITPAEFFDQSAMIQADINEVSGVSDYARGNPQQSIRRTATEAAMIQDSANSRAQDRLMKIEAVLSDAGKRVIQLMQQYMTEDAVARVVSLPVNGWINYDKDYIQGEFDFEVRGGSTEPRNETFRRQSALQLQDIAAQYLDMGVADPVALWQKILRDGFGEKDPGRYVAKEAMGEELQEEAQSPLPNDVPPGMEMAGEQMGLPPGGPGGPGMGGPMPPEMMGAQGPMPPGAGPQMAPGPDPSLGPGGQPLTPEILQMLIAAEQGVDPSQMPPAAMLQG